MNNNLLKKYEKITNNPDFKNRIEEEKIKRKINNIKELNLSSDKITELIIPSLKINKTSSEEIENNYNVKLDEYSNNYVNNLWKTRTDQPYKNILKNEDYSKTISSKDDLVIHKITKQEKDSSVLVDEYVKLKNSIDKHNIELKQIFSDTELLKHKKNFDYVNKYQHRIQYNPKDFNELKDLYEKEQLKIDEEQKRIDEIINNIAPLCSGDNTVRNKYMSKLK
jgi:hypothetical protein